MASPSPPLDDTVLDRAVVIALGANLAPGGDSLDRVLAAAVQQLEEDFRLLGVSRWWRSQAWPNPSDPPFLNGVALAETDLSPSGALAALHRIEARFGRLRSHPNAPRTLDLDLIAHGRTVEEGGALILPHPRAHQRLFVMGPLAEIAPAWRHPVLGLTAGRLAGEAVVGLDAHPIS
jgi:2-amino-4-hydroxy-6-hydroxymethyldihydropteridine diphosphokinase